MPLFLHFVSFYTIDTFIHHSIIQKHSLRPISISSQPSAQWAETSWGAELGFEFGPALQQANTLPTEPRSPVSGMTLSSEVAVSQPAKPPPPRPSAPPSRPSAPPMVPPPRPAPPPPRPDPPQPAKAAAEVPAKVKPAGFSDLFCAPPDPDIGTDIPISLSSGSLVTASGANAGLSLCLL